MESWGCEFLELENYVTPIERHKTMPYSLVSKLVDKNLRANILVKEREYIEHLKSLIRRDGLRQPLQIIIAPNGVTLGDGNHRFVCLEELEYKEIPVFITLQEDHIKQQGMKTYEFARELVYHIYQI